MKILPRSSRYSLNKVEAILTEKLLGNLYSKAFKCFKKMLRVKL